MELRRFLALKRQNPLLRDGIEWSRVRARRYYRDASAALDKLKILDAQSSLAELKRHSRDGAAETVRCNMRFSQTLDHAERCKVAEVVEALAPTDARANQSQSLPIAKAAIINAHNSPCFSPRVTLSQLFLAAL